MTGYWCSGRKIYDIKINVVSFIINLRPLLSNSRCRSTKTQNKLSVFSFMLRSGGYIDGNHLPKEGLLMENTSSMYPYVKLKDIASFNL